MNKIIFLNFNVVITLLIFSSSANAQYEPSILYYNSSNQLEYVSDIDGNHIPDFSYVGYKNGEEPIPNVPVVLEISPIAGDNTAHIQAAIDQVEALPLDTNGHRGALLLLPGEYPVHGSLIINKSGVILRGSGDGENPASNTIIRGVGNVPHQRTLIRIGTNNKSGFGGQVPGTNQNIISPYIPTGSRTFEVADASVYNVGDNIIIKHPSTSAWLNAVDNGGTASDAPWNPGEINLVFNRHITQIQGNKIQVATPIYDILDRSLSQSYVYKFNGNSQIKECGVEDLRIFVESSGVTNSNHVKTSIHMIGVDNSWIRGVTTLRMSDQGVKFDEATRCSVIDTNVLDMHSPISGGWRYNFEVTDFCNNILFDNCTGSNGRHTFVANGASDVNGIVFTNCSSTGDYARSESHRRWGQGILWDNISWSNTNVSGILGLHNRGSYGTGHGWTLTNGVAWNINAPGKHIAIQKPPIGQNYAIGCNATVNNSYVFSHPAGYIEGTGQNLLIQSLYSAQFQDRITHGVLPDTPGKLFPNNYVFTDTEHYLELTWHDISIEEDNYILERSSDGVNFQILAVLPANTETYTDSDLQQDNYYYRLKASNSIGTSPASNTVQTNQYQSPTQTIYVSATGSGAMDGTSESNAYGNFGNAMNQINSAGDKLIVIGTINPTGINLSSKNFAFTIEGLDSNSVLGSSGTSRLFTINSATSANVTFKNLTFLNNNTTLAGGSVFFNNNAGATASFENCTFNGNSVSNAAGGGAIYFANGNLSISNSSFVNNSSTDEGGAIFLQSGTSTITNSIFETNDATTKGGAIHLNNGDLTIANCTFLNNTAANNGGAIAGIGSGNLTISGSLFNGNTGNRGGGIAITNDSRELVMSFSTFVNNTATSVDGGALYLGGTNANSSITNTTVFNNSVINATLNQSKGGGIRLEGARPFTINNSLIYGNFVDDNNGVTNISDIGVTPATVVTLDYSITQIIVPTLDDTAGDVFATSLTEADLSASNLSFNETSGYVEYNSVSVGTDSPIAFGSDGNDAGAWDSGLTLSVNDVSQDDVSIYVNYDSKTLEITHNLNENLSIEIFNIMGSKIIEAKNITQNHSLDISHMKTGIYILTGKASSKSFNKKFIVK